MGMWDRAWGVADGAPHMTTRVPRLTLRSVARTRIEIRKRVPLFCCSHVETAHVMVRLRGSRVALRQQRPVFDLQPSSGPSEGMREGVQHRKDLTEVGLRSCRLSTA